MELDPEEVQSQLAKERENVPEELQASFFAIEDFWERKLWHQLTETLLQFFSDPASASQRPALFQNFVLSFAKKINQLKLVTLGLLTASVLQGENVNEDRLRFLEKLTQRVKGPSSQDAYVHALVATSKVRLDLEQLPAARSELDTAEGILDTFDTVDSEVHASFYRTNAAYYLSSSDYGSYYKNALLYLACINLNTLSDSERRSRAYDLSIAALVSDKIYNFGELLLHPILDSLRDDPQHTWLRDLLFAFNKGDLSASSILAQHASQESILQDNLPFLYQKISLAALTDAVFQRPPHDRAMTFNTISRETNVKHDEIEILVMKALSLGLLRGKIDQVAEIAKITWVQPKVLDLKQVDGMRQRLKEWDGSVNRLGTWIEGVGRDVWAA